MTRAKYRISLRRPVQGIEPLRPMPMFRVAATMSVSSSGCMAVAASEVDVSAVLFSSLCVWVVECEWKVCVSER